MTEGNERQELVVDDEEGQSVQVNENDGNLSPIHQQYGTIQANRGSHRNRTSSRHSRFATMGEFQVIESFLPVSPGMKTRSYSISGDGRPPYQKTVERGRQELYTQVPFTAVFGLGTKERIVEEVFASYAANLNIQSHPEWDERKRRKVSMEANQLILTELEKADSPKKLTLSFSLAIFIATACQFCVGFNTGVMNAPEKVVFPGHSTLEWSMAVAAFAVGGPFGAISGKLADTRGRRGALLITIWIFFLGGLLQTFASGIFIIILSRFLIGFASGISSVVVPIYLGELAPPSLRGALGTMTQFAMVIGIFVADLLAFPLTTKDGWRLLFATTPIVALIQIILSPFLLESPRWLLSHDRKSQKARIIIRQLRGMEYDHEIDQEIANYLLGEAAQHQDETKSQLQIVHEMVSDENMQMLLLSSLFVHISQQFSGINAVFYYSTSFFEGVIENPLVGTFVVGGVNVLATYIALLLMDQVGRKTLLLWSSGGMFAASIVIVLSLLGLLQNLWALVAVNAYVIFFAVGLGPIPWLLVAEMFEGKYVATAMSLCCQLNWACNFMVGMVFPFLNETLGAFSFGPFAIALAFTFMYTLWVLPETQGTTPEALLADIIRHNEQKKALSERSTSMSMRSEKSWTEAKECLPLIEL